MKMGDAFSCLWQMMSESKISYIGKLGISFGDAPVIWYDSAVHHVSERQPARLCYRRLLRPFHLTEELTTTQYVSRTGAGKGEPEE